MNQEKIKYIIEAVLMVSDKPLNIAQIEALFVKDMGEVDRELIKSALEALQADYRDRGIELNEVASGYRIQVRREYAEWANRMFEGRPPRYSRALLETLAIVAYRQPVTRAEIEDIRGVGISSTIIKTLQEREWIRVVGHKDVPGHPELLATTKEFLDYFNLKKLSDLPSLAEIRELTKLNPDLFDTLETMENPGTSGQNTGPAEEMIQDEHGEQDMTIADDDNKVIPISS
jgi:segregation and condensation protein B